VVPFGCLGNEPIRDKRPAAADESETLDSPKRHFTKASSGPLLGLEYFHEYSDRYLSKEQMWRYKNLCIIRVRGK